MINTLLRRRQWICSRRVTRTTAGRSYIRVEGDEVAIGAATRHRDVVESEELRREVPLLPYVAGFVGDRQIRHRGTFGGSLVHGDPAADLPCAVLALGGTFVLQGPSGRRRVEAGDFFHGYFQTAVAEDEMLVEVRVPRVGAAGWGFEKFTRRSNDWAIVAVAAVNGRVALANMGETPLAGGHRDRAGARVGGQPGRRRLVRCRRHSTDRGHARRPGLPPPPGDGTHRTRPDHRRLLHRLTHRNSHGGARFAVPLADRPSGRVR